MTKLPRKSVLAFLFLLSQAASAFTLAETFSLAPVRTGVFEHYSLDFGAAAYSAVRYSPDSPALTFQASFLNPKYTVGFAIFDLSRIHGTVTGATFGGTLTSGDTGLAVSFTLNQAMTAPAAFDSAYDDCGPAFTCLFLTPPAGLLPPGGFAIYEDLTGGAQFANFGFPAGEILPATRTADFNAAGVGAVQAALGGKLVLGINFTGLGTFTLDNVRLNVSTVPLPPALVLFGSAFAILRLRRRAPNTAT